MSVDRWIALVGVAAFVVAQLGVVLVMERRRARGRPWN